MAKILIADDDPQLTRTVRDWLHIKNIHTVDVAKDGGEALDFLATYEYDAVILDWDMPHKTGVDVLKYMRQNGDRTPVLMLTGKDTVIEKTTGLDSGADDYLTKPFVPEELSARIRALLRRHQQPEAAAVCLHDVVLSLDSRSVTASGNSLRLQPADFELLHLLMSAPGERLSAEALLARAWPGSTSASLAGLRSAVRRIRKRLEESGSSMIIQTDGDGYRIDP